MPLVFTLFGFIATMNLLGMFVVIPTATSQLAVTATFAILTIAIVLAVGEIISFLVRPLTLALRLFGNMIGGHVVLNIFGSFVVSLALLALGGGLASLAWAVSALSLGSVVALIALEFIVAFLQAFVFAALACVYLNDVVNLHSH